MSFAPVQSAGLIYQRWLRLPRLTQRLSLGLALALLLSLSFRLLLPSAAPVTEFVPAHQIVPNKVLDQVISENYLNPGGDPLNPKTVAAFRFSGHSGLTFYTFDFQTPKLCGIAGCLYTLYTPDSERVLSLLLSTHLPKEIPLFQVEVQPSSGLPCLTVQQPDPIADLQNPATVLSTQYCYQRPSGKFIAQVQYQQQIHPDEAPTPVPETVT